MDLWTSNSRCRSSPRMVIPVRCTNGIRMAVDASIDQIDKVDLVVIPTIGAPIESA